MAKTAGGLAAAAAGVTGAGLGYSAEWSPASALPAASPSQVPGAGNITNTLPSSESYRPLLPSGLSPFGSLPLAELPPLATVQVELPVPSTPVPEPSGALVLLPVLFTMVLARAVVAAKASVVAISSAGSPGSGHGERRPLDALASAR